MRKVVGVAALVIGLFTATHTASLAASHIIHAKIKKHHNHQLARVILKPFVYVTGMSSYYGREFNGRLMANGKPFYAYHPACAMRYVKLNTWITITNLRNGLTARCAVVDRGPWVYSRVIDVSTSIKLALGMGDLGYVRVAIPIR